MGGDLDQNEQEQKGAVKRPFSKIKVALKFKVLPRLELGSLDSESKVLTITP